MSRRSLLMLVIVSLAMAVVAGAAFAASSSDSSSAGATARALPLAQQKDPDPGEQPEDQGVHGGRVERFHGGKGTSCAVPKGADLSGNWTHGDYVSAWAAAGDPEEVRDAAHSGCGKPVKAAAHETGAPPEPPAGPGKATKRPPKVPPPEPQPPTPA